MDHDGGLGLLAILLSGLRLSTPLIFAALGGLLSEKSGVANIALEGFILIGAFVAGGVTFVCQDPYIGFSAALFAGAAAASVFAFFVLWGRGDHIVMGTGMNLLIMGGLPYASKILFGASGSTPSLSLNLRFSVWWFLFGGLVLACFLHWVLKRTVFGLRLRACGENPEAAQSTGVSIWKVRFMAVMLSGVLAAAAGAFLSIAHGSQYARGMSAGRGFIALAALILAGWRPIPVIFTCLLFGLADAAQIVFQSYRLASGATLPVQFIQMFPYVMTLIVLVVLVGRTSAPKAIGKNF